MKILNIKIFNGSEWVDYVLDDAVFDFSLQSGAAKASVQQKEYTDHEGNVYPNSTIGEGAINFGKGNTAGGINSLTAGQINTNNASGALVIGNDVKNDVNGYYSILAGHHIKNEYPHIAVFGYNLITQNESETLIGRYNNPTISIPLRGGYNRTADNSLLKIGWGQNINSLENAYEFTDKYFASRYPISAQALYADKLCITGSKLILNGDTGLVDATTGTIKGSYLTISARAAISNAIISKGEATKMLVKTAPIDANDVVRKADLSNLEKLIDGLTDDQITALNSFAKSLIATEEV